MTHDKGDVFCTDHHAATEAIGHALSYDDPRPGFDWLDREPVTREEAFLNALAYFGWQVVPVPQDIPEGIPEGIPEEIPAQTTPATTGATTTTPHATAA